MPPKRRYDSNSWPWVATVKMVQTFQKLEDSPKYRHGSLLKKSNLWLCTMSLWPTWSTFSRILLLLCLRLWCIIRDNISWAEVKQQPFGMFCSNKGLNRYFCSSHRLSLLCYRQWEAAVRPATIYLFLDPPLASSTSGPGVCFALWWKTSASCAGHPLIRAGGLENWPGFQIVLMGVLLINSSSSLSSSFNVYF